MVEYFAGLDLGQSQDHTALAVVERAESPGEWDAERYVRRKGVVLRLRYLERVPLGTSYPDVVERVKAIMRSKSLQGRRHLVVDATGVGRPVVDLLRRVELGCRLWPALITGGDTETSSGGYYRVPKRDLIVGLQVLLQSGAFQIAAGLPQGAVLAREMAEMKVKMSGAGREQYGVWRDGEHDDLVLAVSLACWAGRKGGGGEGMRGRLV